MKYPKFEKVFIPIFDIIKQELKADGYLFYGPFGLCCERTVYWVKDIAQCITIEENILGSLTLISDSDGWMIRDENKDTGEFKNGTIGELNGMNSPSIKIDETMNIKWLLKFVKRGENDN